MNKLIKCCAGLIFSCLSVQLLAQTAEADRPAEAGSPAEVGATEGAREAEKTTVAAPKKGKKLIQNATINLQTTVTGNQEQPRVLYILPWQSPESPELDIELLSAHQDAVFGHLEREELQRSLEAAGAMDQPEL